MDRSTLLMFVSFLAGIGVISGLVSNACYGTDPACDYYSMSCNASSIIKLNQLYAGYKPDEVCQDHTQHCDNRLLCCALGSNDFTEPLTLENTYNIYTNCSGRLACTNIHAPWQLLQNDHTSTYVHLEYECTPTATKLPMCGGESGRITRQHSTLDILFDGSVEAFDIDKASKDCRCRVYNLGTQQHVTMTIIDMRMESYYKAENQQSALCSSANFTSDTIVTKCAQTDRHYASNFYFNQQYSLYLDGADDYTDILLQNIHRNGATDSPSIIWLNINAPQAIIVECKELTPADLTTSTTTTTTTTSTTTTTTPTTATTPTTTTTTTPTTTTNAPTQPPTTVVRTTTLEPTTDSTDGVTQPRAGFADDSQKTVVYIAIFVPIAFCIFVIVFFSLWYYRKRTVPHRDKFNLTMHSRGADPYKTFTDVQILDKYINQQGIKANSNSFRTSSVRTGSVIKAPINGTTVVAVPSVRKGISAEEFEKKISEKYVPMEGSTYSASKSTIQPYTIPINVTVEEVEKAPVNKANNTLKKPDNYEGIVIHVDNLSNPSSSSRTNRSNASSPAPTSSHSFAGSTSKAPSIVDNESNVAPEDVDATSGRNEGSDDTESSRDNSRDEDSGLIGL